MKTLVAFNLVKDGCNAYKLDNNKFEQTLCYEFVKYLFKRIPNKIRLIITEDESGDFVLFKPGNYSRINWGFYDAMRQIRYDRKRGYDKTLYPPLKEALLKEVGLKLPVRVSVKIEEIK